MKGTSRPHRTKPAGSYVKPDWKGYLKLSLVIIFFIVLAIIFFNFFAISKTPATPEQVKSTLIAQGYEPKDITEFYYESDPGFKSVLNKCISFDEEDLHFEFFVFNNDNSAVNIYSQAYQKISYKYNDPYSIEIETRIANYSIYLLDSLGKYNVAIYVGNTALYACCDSENKNKIDMILDAIDYLKP
ncbi:MAG: hypothetical protein ACI4I3_09460 [Acutalibacteraceae bacterium]